MCKFFQNLNNSDSWENIKYVGTKQIFIVHFFNTKRHSYSLQHMTHFWSKKLKINYLTYWNTAYIVPLPLKFYRETFWQQVAFCPPTSTVCIAEERGFDVFTHVVKPLFMNGAICQYLRVNMLLQNLLVFLCWYSIIIALFQTERKMKVISDVSASWILPEWTG
jgi:hypothetical protein